MFANASDFAGSACGCTYEKELQPEFLDRLIFYIDGKIRFERYCHGEAAGLVFGVWASGFDEDGRILWEEQAKYDSLNTALPHQITDIQENNTALQFDGQFRRYVKAQEFKTDPENGYTRWALFKMKKKR